MAESVHETCEIDAPPQAVWDVLMDPGRLGEWVSAHRKVEDVPELPLKAGDTFRQRLGVGPAGFWVEWEIEQADGPELARWVGKGPGGSTAKVVYKLSPKGDGTEFSYENDFDPPGGMLGKAAKKTVTSAIGHREARKSLKSLAALF
jgi:uncharacterized protein YndB with AHSA1/START domain